MYVMHIIFVQLDVSSIWPQLVAGLLLLLLAYAVLKRLGLLRLFGLGPDRRQTSPALSPN